MSRILRLELARPGLADNGTPVPVEVLDQIVETWPDVQDAPVILGHPPEHDRAPRFGSVLTVEKVRTREGDLYAGDVEFHDAMADAYEEGHFTRWSIQAKKRPSDGKYQLYSLGMLGGTPPALKKLRVLQMEGVELSDGDDVLTIELADPSAPHSPNPQDDPAPPVLDPKKTAKPADKTVPATSQAAVIDDVEEAVDDANTRQALAVAIDETPDALRARIAKLEADAARRGKVESDVLLERVAEAVAGQPLDVQAAAVELAEQLSGVGADGVISLSDGDKTLSTSAADGFLRFVKTLGLPVEAGLIELGDRPSKTKAAATETATPADGRKMARAI